MKQQTDRPHSNFVEFLTCVSYRAGQEKLEVLRRGPGGDHLWMLGPGLPRLREFDVSDGIEAMRKVWDRLPQLMDEGKGAIQTALAGYLKGKFPEDNSAIIACAIWSCLLLHGAQSKSAQKPDQLLQLQTLNHGERRHAGGSGRKVAGHETKQSVPTELSATKQQGHLATRDFTSDGWTAKDSRLCLLTVRKRSQEINQQIERKIYERGLRGLDTSSFLGRIRISVSGASDIVKFAYDTCSKILEESGREKTPELVQVIYDKHLLPPIRGRKNGIWQEVQSRLAAAGILESDPVAKNAKDYLDRQMTLLESDWRAEIEREKLELENRLLARKGQSSLESGTTEQPQPANRSDTRNVGRKRSEQELSAIPDLDTLKTRKSLLKIEAAKVFLVDPKTIRNWINKGKLNVTPKGRVVTTDQAFEELYRAVHEPASR